MKKVVNFIAKANQSRLNVAIQEMVMATEKYFTDAIKVNYQGATKLVEEGKEALRKVEYFKSRGAKSIEDMVKQIPARLQDKITEKKSDFIFFIENCSTQWDGKSVLVNSELAQEYLDQESNKWTKTHIIDVVFAEFADEFNKMLEKEMQEFLEDASKNDFILDALRTALPLFQDDETLFMIAGGVSGLAGLFFGASAFYLIPGILTAIAGAVSAVIVVPILLTIVLGVVLAVKQSINAIDAKWKRKIAEQYHNKFIDHWKGFEEKGTNACEGAVKLFYGFTDALEKKIKEQMARRETLALVWGKWFNLATNHRNEFGTLYAKLIACHYEFLHWNCQPEKIEKIYDSGFGEVWKGKWKNQLVLLKYPKFPDSTTIMGLFSQEVLINQQCTVKRLNNVLTNGIVLKNMGWVLILPFFSTNLAAFLQENPDLSFVKRLAIITKIAEGLSNLHSIGIIHRGLKQENILINHNNTEVTDLVVADLGIDIPDDCSLRVRTENCMAFEVFAANTTGNDKAADVFAFGVMMLEILVPHLGKITPQTNILELLNSQLLPVPDLLKSLIQNCCSETPNCRPISAQVLEQLNNCK